MPYKYNQKLPKEVEKALDDYVERIRNIKWFKPSRLQRDQVDTQINVAIKAFGIEASIEYRRLANPDDWGAARDAAWGAAWDAAWDAARDAAWGAARGAAWGAAWDAAWDAARDAAWDAARDAAWGAADVLASLTPESIGYKKRYPNGNFVQLVALWELGLYPIGIVDGVFICYVPDVPEAAELLER